MKRLSIFIGLFIVLIGCQEFEAIDKKVDSFFIETTNELEADIINEVGLEELSDGDGESSLDGQDNVEEVEEAPLAIEPVSLDCGPSDEAIQQALLQAINEVRNQVTLCAGVEYPPVKTLSLNSQLSIASQRHADDMALNNLAGNQHQGTDGTRFVQRVQDTDYDGFAAGEIVSPGNTVEQAMSMWLNSPPHCVGIMSSSFDEMGGACARRRGSFGKWTIVFGEFR